MNSVRLNQFVEALDVHETTPVHLAFRMRRKEYLALFFDKVHSSFFERNLSLLDEAINYKDKLENKLTFIRISCSDLLPKGMGRN